MGDNNKNTNSHRPADLPFITRLKLFLLELSQSFYIRPDDSINRRIFSLIDFKASAARSTKPIDRTFVSTSDVPVEPADLWFRLFIPSTTGPDSTHFDHLCTNLAAKAPAVVASVNYRLSPEHKYPSQYDDGLDALRFIDAQNYDVLPAAADLSRCFVMGDSSGGNIAHHVTVRALEKENTMRQPT
ncbi:probable carboxylesterase 18 [Phtheirospermum japonicum]|uniref:Probable carboxylesterase 18 n=1 Tax=Phtheirospermum japonicum TaxID=374723 RepID=A0A830DLA9_9LAMI|nr:probable carboxylesterase 18 [Phtheirospermum japonicum]